MDLARRLLAPDLARRLLAPALAVLLLPSCAAPQRTTAPASAPASVLTPAPCPQELPPGSPPPVPQQPPVELAGRLVPDAVPDAALVCRYGPVSGPETAAPLTAQRALDAGLERLPEDLALPRRLGPGRACQAAAGPQTRWLLRLAYPDAVVWVSTAQEPGACTSSGNGAFVTSHPLGAQLAASAATGAWTALPGSTPGSCAGDQAGRAGQEGFLVPGRPVALDLCTDGGPARRLPDDVRRPVQQVLSGPVAQPSDGSCRPVRPGPAHVLRFSYAEGRPVLVRFTVGCAPDVDNGSLQAQLEPDEERRLRGLLER